MPWLLGNICSRRKEKEKTKKLKAESFYFPSSTDDLLQCVLIVKSSLLNFGNVHSKHCTELCAVEPHSPSKEPSLKKFKGISMAGIKCTRWVSSEEAKVSQREVEGSSQHNGLNQSLKIQSRAASQGWHHVHLRPKQQQVPV